MSLGFAETPSGPLSPLHKAHIQNLLNENFRLIRTIENFQDQGKIQECMEPQQLLYKNLTVIGMIADIDNTLLSKLPAPPARASCVTERPYHEAHFLNNLSEQHSEYQPPLKTQCSTVSQAYPHSGYQQQPLNKQYLSPGGTFPQQDQCPISNQTTYSRTPPKCPQNNYQTISSQGMAYPPIASQNQPTSYGTSPKDRLLQQHYLSQGYHQPAISQKLTASTYAGLPHSNYGSGNIPYAASFKTVTSLPLSNNQSYQTSYQPQTSYVDIPYNNPSGQIYTGLQAGYSLQPPIVTQPQRHYFGASLPGQPASSYPQVHYDYNYPLQRGP